MGEPGSRAGAVTTALERRQRNRTEDCCSQPRGVNLLLARLASCRNSSAAEKRGAPYFAPFLTLGGGFGGLLGQTSG